MYHPLDRHDILITASTLVVYNKEEEFQRRRDKAQEYCSRPLALLAHIVSNNHPQESRNLREVPRSSKS